MLNLLALDGLATHGICFRAMSPARSPIMTVVALVLPDTTVGMIGEAATRKP